MPVSVLNPKINSRTVISIVKIIFGCIIAVNGIFSAAPALFSAFFRSTPPDVRCGLTVLAAGLLLIESGVSSLRCVALYKRLMSLPPDAEGQTCKALAHRLDTSSRQLLRQLQILFRQGFWQKMESSGNEMVFTGYGLPALKITAADGRQFVKKLRHSPAAFYALGLYLLVFWESIVYYDGFRFYISVLAGCIIFIIVHRLSRRQMRVAEVRRCRKDRTGRKHIGKRKQLQEEISTGSKENDSFLGNIRAEIARVRELPLDPESSVGAHAIQLMKIADRIIEQLIESPDKIRTSRQFLKYYLPGAVNLLVSYSELERQEYKGENILESMKKIEQSLPGMVNSFLRELDRLHLDKALSISAEVAVLEKLK